MGAAGIVLGWVTINRYHIPQDWGIVPMFLLGLLAFSMTLTGVLMTFFYGLVLLLSPIGEEPPPLPSIDHVRNQKAYGDARAANAAEVDAALRGGDRGPQREFKD
jgi:hypothetical protein